MTNIQNLTTQHHQQFSFFDIASDVQSLEMRKTDAYVHDCMVNKTVQHIFSHGMKSITFGLRNSYALYQLPNCDLVYLSVTYGNYDIYDDGEESFNIIEYIPCDNPKQMNKIFHLITDNIVEEARKDIKKNEIIPLNSHIGRLMDDNEKLKQELLTQTQDIQQKQVIIKNLELQLKSLEGYSANLEDTNAKLKLELFMLELPNIFTLKSWLFKIRKSIFKFIK